MVTNGTAATTCLRARKALSIRVESFCAWNFRRPKSRCTATPRLCTRSICTKSKSAGNRPPNRGARRRCSSFATESGSMWGGIWIPAVSSRRAVDRRRHESECGSFARNTGLADPEDGCPPAHARLGNRAAHPANLARGAANSARFSLSGVVPAGTKGIGPRRMGRLGKQSPREVLHADEGRPPAIGEGIGAVGAVVFGCSADSPARVRIRAWIVILAEWSERRTFSYERQAGGRSHELLAAVVLTQKVGTRDE